MQNKKILKWLNLGMVLLLVSQSLSLMLLGVWPNALALHQAGGVMLLILGACHLFLNRAWVKSTYFSRKKG